MRYRWLRWPTALGLSGMLAACSALGLGDYDIIECEPREPCRELNETLPAGQCQRYYCRADGFGCGPEPRDEDRDGFWDPAFCDLADGKADCDDTQPLRNEDEPEACDGIDNDCDDSIDEETNPSRDLAELVLPGDISGVTYAALPDGAMLVPATHADPSAPWQLETTAFVVEASGESRELAWFEGQDCAGVEAAIACRISDLALASTADVLVGAGVHRAGCEPGQLRVGVGSPFDMSLRLGINSPAAAGVDNDGSACSTSSDCDGASLPAVAALPGDRVGSRGEALVAWLAPTKSGAASSCEDSTDFRLGIAPLALRSADGHAALAPLEDRAEKLLGLRSVTGRPTVVANVASAMEPGFVVAHPSDDQLVVIFVPRRDGRQNIGDDFVEMTIAAPGVSHVSLSVPDPATAAGLAVAFRTESERGSALRFIALEIEPGDEPSIVESGPTLTLDIEGPIAAGPVLGYLPTGFTTASSGKLEGGWLLLWAEGSPTDAQSERLMALRITEADPNMRGEPVVLVRGITRDPFIYLKHDGDSRSLGFGFTKERSVHLIDLRCEMGN